MTDTQILANARVAFLATGGFEDSELTSPWQALLTAGATPIMVSTGLGSITGKHGHVQPIDATLETANPGQFTAVVLPGGTSNSARLRSNATAQKFVQDFLDNADERGRTLGVICHGGWLLADADVVAGHTMTSVDSISDDLVTAGADWVDEPVVADGAIVSSRVPDDLPDFNRVLIEEIARRMD